MPGHRGRPGRGGCTWGEEEGVHAGAPCPMPVAELPGVRQRSDRQNQCLTRGVEDGPGVHSPSFCLDRGHEVALGPVILSGET